MLELFYVSIGMERWKFTTEMKNQLNILIEKEREMQLGKEFKIIDDVIEQKREKTNWKFK